MATEGVSLVIGAHGVLGRSVSERLRTLGHTVVEASRRPTADALPLEIDAMAASWALPPGVTTAYFCAAVTSQTSCRDAFAQAYAINVTNTVLLIRRLVEAGVFVVFPSTNLVFDGSQPQVSAESARCPRTAYGRMKSEAEIRILAIGGSVGVVRLTKVVHAHLPVFARWRTSLTQGLTVQPFHDMVFSPLPLHEAVSVLLAVGRNRVTGVTQAAAQDDVSYAQACRLLARHLTVPEALVTPVSWHDSDVLLEHVPEHTTLDTTRAEQLFGFRPPRAQEALEEVFDAPNTIQDALAPSRGPTAM